MGNRGEYLKTSQIHNTQSEQKIDKNFNYNSKTRRTNSLEEFEKFERILNKELDSTYQRILQKTRKKNSRSEFHAENSLNHQNQTNSESKSKSKIKINPLQNLSKHTSNSIQSRVNLLLKKSNQLEQYQRSVLHRSEKAHEDTELGSITESDIDSYKPFVKEGDNCPSSSK